MASELSERACRRLEATGLIISGAQPQKLLGKDGRVYPVDVMDQQGGVNTIPSHTSTLPQQQPHVVAGRSSLLEQ
jgi:hypothetical protein